MTNKFMAEQVVRMNNENEEFKKELERQLAMNKDLKRRRLNLIAALSIYKPALKEVASLLEEVYKDRNIDGKLLTVTRDRLDRAYAAAGNALGEKAPGKLLKRLTELTKETARLKKEIKKSLILGFLAGLTIAGVAVYAILTVTGI